MFFANELYAGYVADQSKNQIVRDLQNGIYNKDHYILALSETEGDLLEIQAVTTFQNPVYLKYNPIDKRKVVGLAVGKTEAMDLLREIVADIYNKTGELKIKQYFTFQQGD